MARYDGPNGELVEAVQLDEDREFNMGGQVVGAKRGEWLVRTSDGTQVIAETAYFAASYKQVYPKPVDGQRADEPAATSPTGG